MDRLSPTALKAQQLKERYRLLTEQYKNACQQRNTTLDAAQRPQLQCTADALWEQICAVDEELQQIERSSTEGNMRQRQERWDDALQKIDFKKAWHDFKELYDRQINLREGGAALLLAPDYRTMCADLFVQGLYGWLQGEIGYGKVRRVEAVIRDFSRLTPELFLGELGSSMNVAPNTIVVNGAAQVSMVTDKLFALLDTGHMLFVEVTAFIDLYSHESFLLWLLDEFWPALQTSLAAAARERTRMKCLFVFQVEPKAPRSLPLKERYCPLRSFEPAQRQFARLPLTPWGKDEIEEWLVHHSGLTDGMSTQTLDDLVHAIFIASRNGVPWRVKDELAKRFRQY